MFTTKCFTVFVCCGDEFVRQARMGRRLPSRGGLDLSLKFRPKAQTKVDKYQSSNPDATRHLDPSSAYPFTAALQLVTARGSVS